MLRWWFVQKIMAQQHTMSKHHKLTVTSYQPPIATSTIYNISATIGNWPLLFAIGHHQWILQLVKNNGFVHNSSNSVSLLEKIYVVIYLSDPRYYFSSLLTKPTYPSKQFCHHIFVSWQRCQRWCNINTPGTQQATLMMGSSKE